MLQHARRLYSGANIRWIESTFEGLELSPSSVHLIVACLSFHFVERLDDLLKRCSAWLSGGGVLVFSVRHPIRTCNPTGETKLDGEIAWTVKDYFQEGPRQFNWLGTRCLNFHRTLSTYMKMLSDAGMIVEKVVEPTSDTSGFSLESKSVPFFLTFSCRKPQSSA
jgi:ubiquinone/menaquinone biosynthesis C-methylase UbiE